MSKPWGGIGAWAAEAEREEAEEKEAAAAAGIGSNADSQSFPSLKEAVKEKSKKKKMSLSEFNMGAYSSPAGGIGGARGAEYNRLTPEEMMSLPTRPKERSAEEMQYGRLGGGFPSYGRSGPPPGRAMRDREESDGSWGTGRRQYGGFDEERRGPPPRASEYDQPSRADEVDNWAMGKKSAPAFDSGRQNRYGGLGTGGGVSRADEVDNWLAVKKPIAARSSSFGSGFRGSAPEPDRWSRGGGGFREERSRLALDPPSGEVNEQVVRTNKPNPFGAARPREEVLAEKGLDWKQVDSEIEAKKANERPTSSQSSRPSSAHSSRSETQQPVIENVVRTRPKVNPFGDAKPREVLLQERGQDWRKIDLELEHRRVDRPEQDEERILKEEIDNLRKELEKGSAGDQSSLHDRLLQKQKDLEMLIRDFDDKLKFGQKVERPGSGAGRIGGFPDRPPSQAGSSDGSRIVDYANRPRSRGTGDAWTRSGDDRRPFQGGRERGFLNRDMDRSRSRERW
ncbi:hypothetical protein SLEP1_g25456 [Rubroshorea leprosula]|uniref:Uncharacterized protein n=1 Tax=Rubroshorea leprosula TaxID=152421 RepID=A0AAV5JTI1_9ROSI|nr:hypothetical protein SLEP1_g25456 [Rubroshorea leprosula]